LTAYGPTFEKDGEGILILKTSADVKKDLESLGKAAREDGKEIKVEQKEPYLLYNVNDDFYIAPSINGWVVIGKRQANIEEGHAVPPDTPGLGIAWDFAALSRHTVARHTVAS
jgi:hypothetical protein